jgi:hypothetical protein
MMRTSPAVDSTSTFLRRFDAFAADYRRRHLWRSICWSLAMALAVYVGLAALDYVFELGYAFRASAAALLLGAALIALIMRAVVTSRRATDRAIAATLEDRFPELGQAVRTAVDYRDADARIGASPALLAAMHEDLDERTSTLALDQALANCRTRRAAIILAAGAAVVLSAVAASWQWRLAARRTLFGDEPYTRVLVTQDDAVVEEGKAPRVAATVEGRLRPTVLMTRPTSPADAPWISRELTPDEEVQRTADQVQYKVEMPKLEHPVEYRLVAGPYSTPTRQVAVRRLLDIKAIQIEVEPPAYTGAAPAVFEDGSFRGLTGSRARMKFTLDRPLRNATIELTSLESRPGEAVAPATQSMELAVDGRTLIGEFELTSDAVYTVAGRGVDGAPLRENRYRIRALRDQLPRITFRDPAIESETHSLAEIPMLANVHDDYGLTKAGIVFRVNNGREYPLVTFPPASAPGDADSAGGIPSNATLEAVLPLEELDVTQRDSVAYYAFAEDNAPDGVRRMETEIRFLDIRPFRRLFNLPDPAGGGGVGGGGGRRLASLEQLIRRERWLLNRSLRLARNVERGDRVNLDDVDDAISMQDDTAGLTRELADAAAEIEDNLGIEEDRISDLFYAAEEAMMRAVDALSVSEFQPSYVQQADAAASLVAARDAIEIAIGQGGGGGAFARLFRLDNELLRRMRGRRSDEQRLEEAAQRLRALASREGRLADGLEESAAFAESASDGDNVDEQASSRAADRMRDMEKEQFEITEEAENVDNLVQEIESGTELVRTRSKASIEASKRVTDELDGGVMAEAARTARQASRQFRELAQHVDGISPPEPAGRLAAARDVSAAVALDLRNMSEQLAAMSGANGEPPSTFPSGPLASNASFTNADAVGDATDAVAESTTTAGDVLESIVTAFGLQEDGVVPRLRQVLDQSDVGRTGVLLERIEADLLAERWQEAGLKVDAAADLMDQLANRLEALHASIVAPRLAQVQALVVRATELQTQLAELDSQDRVNRWRQKLQGLVEDVESAEIRLAAAPELRAMASAAPADPALAAAAWKPLATGYLQPPQSYVTTMDEAVVELQRYLHELAFGRVDAASADQAPPEYVDFVRRYLELLSEGAGR